MAGTGQAREAATGYRHPVKTGTVIVPAHGLGADVKIGLEKAILKESDFECAWAGALFVWAVILLYAL